MCIEGQIGVYSRLRGTVRGGRRAGEGYRPGTHYRHQREHKATFILSQTGGAHAIIMTQSPHL